MGPTEPTGSGKGRKLQSSNLAPRPLAAVSGREGGALGIALLRLESWDDRVSAFDPHCFWGLESSAPSPLFFSASYLIFSPKIFFLGGAEFSRLANYY